MSETQEIVKENVKKVWGGISSLWSTVKQKTLDIVDDLQDQITALDEQVSQSQTPPPKKEFDRALLPILENASTYIEESTDPNFKDFLESFSVDEHQPDITLFCDNSPNLRRIRARLVPSAIEERVFWSRLFFKLQQREKSKNAQNEKEEHKKVSENANDTNLEDFEQNLELTPEELAELEKLGENGEEDWENWE